MPAPLFQACRSMPCNVPKVVLPILRGGHLSHLTLAVFCKCMQAMCTECRDSMNDKRLTAVLCFALQNAAFWRFQKSRGLHLPVAKLLFLNSKGPSCYPMISGDFVVDLILHIDRDCTLIETCVESFRSRCFIDQTFSEGTTTPPPSKTSSTQQDIRRILWLGRFMAKKRVLLFKC